MKKELKMRNQKPKIIVALDGMEYDEAVETARRLSVVKPITKVNDALDSPKGLQILSDLGALGEVMDDSKFFEIKKTMKNRVSKHAAYGPKFITIHAINTMDALIVAKRAAANSMILGVTVLTTYTTEECEIKIGASTKAKVLQYSRDALCANLDGIVCSGQELEFLSKFEELNSLIRVVPAIRSKKLVVKNDDQERIIYIPEAVKLGADYFVIGRPITEASDPVAAYNELQEEIEVSWMELQNSK